MDEQPEVFGMHDNALVAYNVSETTRVVDTILSLQPRVTTKGDGDAKTPEQMVDEMCEVFQQGMPADLDLEDACPGLFDRDPETMQMDSLATVLLQEMDR